MTVCEPEAGEEERTPRCTPDTTISPVAGRASHSDVGRTAISSRKSRDTSHRKNISRHETSGAFLADSPRGKFYYKSDKDNSEVLQNVLLLLHFLKDFSNLI